MLEHQFQRKGNKHHHFLLDGVYSFKEFDKRIQKLSKEVYKLKPIYQTSWPHEKIMGDCFEWFGEAFIKILGADNRIGLVEYHPIAANDDFGADGKAIGMNGLPAGIQFKYKTNHTSFVMNNDDHIGNFTHYSYKKLGVPLTTSNLDSNLTIITTGNGLNPKVHEDMPIANCRCIAWNHLLGMLENNNIFWDAFRNLVFTNPK